MPSNPPTPQEEVLRRFAHLRPRIRAAKSKLNALYALQNEAYINGHKMDVPIAHMAKAGGPEFAVGDQAVRDVIRRHQALHEEEG